MRARQGAGRGRRTEGLRGRSGRPWFGSAGGEAGTRLKSEVIELGGEGGGGEEEEGQGEEAGLAEHGCRLGGF